MALRVGPFSCHGVNTLSDALVTVFVVQVATAFIPVTAAAAGVIVLVILTIFALILLPLLLLLLSVLSMAKGMAV